MEPKARKILIVDDTKEDLYLLETSLERSGYDVISSRNGVEAIEKLKNNTVDMIVSDILMPGMDGFQLCRECKKDNVLKKIPFVFYTATYTDEKDEEFALSLGAEKFIVKPCEINEFLGILEAVIESDRESAPVVPVNNEEAYLTKYNKRLVEKIEHKVLILEKEIERRKQIEDALTLERDKTRKYLDIVNVIIVVIDPDHRVSLINKRGCEVLGYSEHEIIGKNWFNNFLPEEDRDKVMKVFDMLLAGNIEPVEKFENPILNKAGRRRIISWHNTFLRDCAGNIVSIISSGEDITERKKAEKTLLEQKMTLEQKNIALNEILGQIEIEKKQIKENVIANAENLLLPIIQKLKLEGKSRKYVQLLEKNLQKLTSSFGTRLTQKRANLTTREIDICNMIKNGLTNKEIARLLNISIGTIERHRANIRKKLGIINKDINLTSFLNAL